MQPKPSQRGKDRTFDPEVLEPVIRGYIDAQNRLLQPVTAQKIVNEVKNKCNVLLELRTMQRLLHELDFHYIVGKKRHISADTPANVEFRNAYLKKKLSNRRPGKKVGLTLEERKSF
jgi:transposase